MAAGCTQQDSESEQKQFETADRTTDFTEITYSSEDISPGRRVTIRAVIQNNNVLEAKNVRLELMNTAPLEFEGSTGFQDSSEQSCSFDQLAPATENYGGDIRSCRWTLTCPEDSQCSSTAENFESYNVPMRIRLSYETEITNLEDAITVEYLSLEDMTDETTTEKRYRAKNGDISLETGYRTPQPVDEDNFDLDLSMSNTGNGQLDSEGISITYTGPFTNHLEDTDSCDTLILSDGRESVSTSCMMPLTDIESGNIYQMRLRGRYKYSKTENIQLKITS